MIHITKTLFSKARDKQLDEYQAKVVSIIQSNSNKTEKQQQLLKLASELGIPKHTADKDCICLSYSDTFYKIADWIKSQRDELNAERSVYAAWFSAATALLAILISVYIHWQTRQLLAPTERPVISVIDSEAKGKVSIDSKQLSIVLRVFMKNIGKHPAGNIRMRVWAAPIDSPMDIYQSRDTTKANPLYPDIKFTWRPTFVMKAKGDMDVFNTDKPRVFIFIKLNYIDLFHHSKKYEQEYYCVYEMGEGSLGDAAESVKTVFEPYLKEIGAIK